MKKTLSIVLAAALLLLCAACGTSPAPSATEATATASPAPATAIPEPTAAPTETPATLTVTDHNGDTVTLPSEIDRIAICSIWPLASVLTVFFNSADKLVGIPEQSMSAAKNGLLGQLYPEILNARTDYIDGNNVNVETLLELDPDVVFYSASAPAIGEQLKNAGFTAVAVSVDKWDYDCIETLKQWIALLGEIFPEDDKSALVRQYCDDTYELVQSRVSGLADGERARLFVLFQYSESSILTSGGKHFGQWWCDAINAVNVAQADLPADGTVQVNMEQIYAWNPGVLLVTNFTAAQAPDIYGSTIGAYDWSGIDAVLDQRVYKMPMGIYRDYTPSADTPMTLLWLAKTVYPDLFEDIDVTAQVRDYYKAVFGVDLTDGQIASIFAPSSAAAGGVS